MLEYKTQIAICKDFLEDSRKQLKDQWIALATVTGASASINKNANGNI